MRPFWTRFLSPQDKKPGREAPVKTLRYPSDEAEIPDPRQPGPGAEAPAVWTMRFPSDEPELPDTGEQP